MLSARLLSRRPAGRGVEGYSAGAFPRRAGPCRVRDGPAPRRPGDGASRHRRRNRPLGHPRGLPLQPGKRPEPGSDPGRAGGTDKPPRQLITTFNWEARLISALAAGAQPGPPALPRAAPRPPVTSQPRSAAQATRPRKQRARAACGPAPLPSLSAARRFLRRFCFLAGWR